MSSPFKNVLLIGASGTLGKTIQAELIAKKHFFSRIGTLTSPDSLTDAKKAPYWASLKGQGVEVDTVDFSDSDALTKAFAGWDAVISAVGLPMVKAQLPMIEAAAAAGVKRFLPSEFGFDLTIPSNSTEKVYAMKIAVAQKVEEVAKKYPEFTYTFLAVGSFAAFPFMVPAMFDIDYENCTACVVGDGKAPISFTSFQDAATFAIAVLVHPEETKNKVIRVEGTVASWNEIIGILEKVHGKAYAVTYLSTEEAQAKEIEFWGAGTIPLAARYALRRVMAQGNAKMPVVQNSLFPEVTATTNLEKLIGEVLREKGVIKN